MIELVVNLFKIFEIILVFDVAELSLSRTIYSFPLEIHFHVSLGSVLMGKDYELHVPAVFGLIVSSHFYTAVFTLIGRH